MTEAEINEAFHKTWNKEWRITFDEAHSMFKAGIAIGRNAGLEEAACIADDRQLTCTAARDIRDLKTPEEGWERE